MFHPDYSLMELLTYLLGMAAGTISLKTSSGNYVLDQYLDNKYPAGSLVYGRTGAAAGPDNAAGGSLVVTITLPATPWAAAASKSKAKQGTWSNAASAGGTLGHFRLENAAGTEREEGSITVTGGGGDMTVDNTNVLTGQVITVTTYTRTV